MVDIELLVQKAKKLKDKGLSEKEITDELHLAIDTVNWLLSAEAADGIPPSDVKIGWRSCGIYGKRIMHLAAIMADIVLEEAEKLDFEPDTVVGVAINGIPLATMLALQLDVEMAIFKPTSNDCKETLGGSLSSNYAGLKGKNVIIVDDVLSSGQSLQSAIEEVREAGATPVLGIVIANKTSRDVIADVPIRGLIRARSVGGTILSGGPITSFPYA